MKATLVDHMGDDITVVNAARVSFAKQSDFVRMKRTVNDPNGSYDVEDLSISEGDVKLINYLAKHNHWTPFGHPQIQLHVKAPIFVARQMVKHQVGLVWNEVSRRYVSDAPEFWWPTEWRLKAENKKQGSSDEVIPFNELQLDWPDSTYASGPSEMSSIIHKITKLYSTLLVHNIAPEMARIILPQNMYTEWYWTGSLAAWARVCKLRLDPHAQKEAQDLAKQFSEIIQPLFPVSWKALLGELA